MARPNDADVKILVGVLGEGKVSGTSGELIKKQIDQIFGELNNDKHTASRKIKVSLDEHNTKQAIKASLKNALDDIKAKESFSISISEIKASSAIQKLKNDVSAALKTLKVSTGFDVEISESGRITAIREIADDAEKAALSVAEATARLKEMKTASSEIDRAYKSIQKASLNTEFSNETTAKIRELEQAYVELNSAMNSLNAHNVTPSALNGLYARRENVEALIQQVRALMDAENKESEESKKGSENADNSEKKRYATVKQIADLYSQLDKYLKSNSSAKGTNEYHQLELIHSQLEEAATSASNLTNEFSTIGKQSFDAVVAKIASLKANIKSAGKEGKSFSTIIVDAFTKFGGWSLVTKSMTAVYSKLKDMVEVVKDIDSAMTELKKVMDETDEVYQKFLDNAVTRAKELGATVSDTVSASADFARLGYSIDEAAELADASIIYKNVGDGISDIGEASESVISTMQAFGVEVSDVMTIVDKFNSIGNNFAISSAGVGEAMTRSASAMKAAGNTIDETVALIATANTVVQNPEAVGKTCPTTQ